MGIFNKKEPLEVIRGKVEAYNKALDDANAAVEEAESKVAAAQSALEDAADQNDAAAFSAAKKQLADAETALEMANMRKERLVEKGAVPKEEVNTAINTYEALISMINARACKEIIEKLTALNDAIDEANKEAGQLYQKEKALCALLGVKFNPGFGNVEVMGHYIAAHSYRSSWPSNSSLTTNRDLQRFAAKAK